MFPWTLQGLVKRVGPGGDGEPEHECERAGRPRGQGQEEEGQAGKASGTSGTQSSLQIIRVP